MTSGWDGYISSFHRDRAGITERLLRRSCGDAGVDPYTWLVGVVEEAPVVLDVGSGSGPMAGLVPSWVGVDRSAEELAVGRLADRLPSVRASAAALPVRGASVRVAVAAMSLQVLEPIDEVMHELARVVQAAGQLVLLLPARGPVPAQDAFFYLGVQWRLRQRIRYPNDRHLGRKQLAKLASACGFLVEEDVSVPFSLSIRDRDDAEELVTSLYLPGVTQSRVDRAVALVSRRIGSELTIPLRRVILRRRERGLNRPAAESRGQGAGFPRNRRSEPR